MAISQRPGQPTAMLTGLYVDALLVDEELVDLVWEALEVGLITDELAAFA